MGEPDSAETPWAMIQRLRAENQPEERIFERLKTSGLSDADVELLGVKRMPEAATPAAAPRSKVVRGALLGVLAAGVIDAVSVLALFETELLVAPVMIYAVSLIAMTKAGRPEDRLAFGVVMTLLAAPGFALNLFVLVASTMPHGVA